MVDLPQVTWGRELGKGEEFIEIITKGEVVELWCDGVRQFEGGIGDEFQEALKEAKYWMESLGHNPHVVISASRNLAFEIVSDLHRVAATHGIIDVSYSIQVEGGRGAGFLVQLRSACGSDFGPSVIVQNDGMGMISILDGEYLEVTDLESELFERSLEFVRDVAVRNGEQNSRVFLRVESEVPVQTFVQVAAQLGSRQLDVILDQESFLLGEATGKGAQ